jgi:hypothetical protein
MQSICESEDAAAYIQRCMHAGVCILRLEVTVACFPVILYAWVVSCSVVCLPLHCLPVDDHETALQRSKGCTVCDDQTVPYYCYLLSRPTHIKTEEGYVQPVPAPVYALTFSSPDPRNTRNISPSTPLDLNSPTCDRSCSIQR